MVIWGGSAYVGQSLSRGFIIFGVYRGCPKFGNPNLDPGACVPASQGASTTGSPFPMCQFIVARQRCSSGVVTELEKPGSHFSCLGQGMPDGMGKDWTGW